jgi:hypothetical protein
MTDIHELTSCVESNPNDHDKRWRLAKKLYMATDYRNALGHLLVLQTNWTPKVNVLRYLAATYYRLGRHDEAIAELKSGIKEWPEEIPLIEQLARVLEVSGRYEEAIDAWRDVLKRNPNNSMAKRLLRKLQEAKPEKKEKEGKEPAFQAGDLSVGAMLGSVCPSCGAQNSEEFDRCWKCHAPLANYGMPDVRETSSEREEAPSRSSALPVLYILCGVAAMVLIGFGAYLSIKQLLALREAAADQVLVCTVREVFDSALLSTRLSAGLVLLVVWPVVLWLAGNLMQPGLPAQGPLLVGCLLASAGYLSLWSAPGDAAYIFVTVLLLAIIPIVGVMQMGLTQAIVVWLIQGVLVLGFVVGSVAAVEGVTFLKEFPTVIRYAEVHDGVQKYGGEPGRYVLSSLYTPVETRVRWDSTGATWLDSRANRVGFEISSDGAVSGVTIEIKGASGTSFYERGLTLPYKFTFDKVAPGNSYQLLLTGPDNAKLDVTVRGLLTPHFGG